MPHFFIFFIISLLKFKFSENRINLVTLKFNWLEKSSINMGNQLEPEKEQVQENIQRSLMIGIAFQSEPDKKKKTKERYVVCSHNSLVYLFFFNEWIYIISRYYFPPSAIYCIVIKWGDMAAKTHDKIVRSCLQSWGWKHYSEWCSFSRSRFTCNIMPAWTSTLLWNLLGQSSLKFDIIYKTRYTSCVLNYRV